MTTTVAITTVSSSTAAATAPTDYDDNSSNGSDDDACTWLLHQKAFNINCLLTSPTNDKYNNTRGPPPANMLGDDHNESRYSIKELSECNAYHAEKSYSSGT